MNFWNGTREANGPAAASNRQPMPLTAAHYLSQLRPPAFKVPAPRPRQQISVQIEEQPLSLCVVKFIQRG